MVIAFVGKNNVRFMAHLEVFNHPHAGGFVATAFTNGFKEASDRVLKLPEDNPKAFGIFLKWLYDISLGLGSAIDSLSSLLPDTQTRIDTYGFAQKYSCHDLQDMIMSKMYYYVHEEGHKAETELSHAMLQDLATNVKASRMHTLLARWIAKDTLLGEISDFDMVPNDLLRMVMKEMRGVAKFALVSRNYPLGPRCYYHLHKDTARGICPFE